MIEIELIELSKIELLRLIHLFTCFFGGLFLILMWKRITNAKPELKQDLGLVFVACALFLWVAMDLYRFIGFMKPGYVSLVIKTFSAYNNGFFIASLPFFSNTFHTLRKKLPLFENKTKWALVVLLVNIGFVFFYSMFWGEKQENSLIVSHFDFIYSTVTYIFLGYAIITSFRNRERYRSNFYYIALVLTFLLISVQVGFSPFFTIMNYDVLSATAFVSQMLLILTFIVLAQAWYTDIVEIEKNQMAVSMDEKVNKLTSEIIDLKTAISVQQAEFEKEKSLVFDLNSKLTTYEDSYKTSMEVRELSDRELEVLGHIDKSYLEIGKILHISRDTVITHKKNIESKLGIKDKLELAEYARKNGLLKV